MTAWQLFPGLGIITKRISSLLELDLVEERRGDLDLALRMHT